MAVVRGVLIVEGGRVPAVGSCENSTGLLAATGELPAAFVADRRYKVVEILFVLQAAVIEKVVTNLAPENFLRRKWFYEEDRIIISNDVLERIGVRQPESLGQVQLVAVFVTIGVEPGSIVDADGVRHQCVSLPFAHGVPVPRRIVVGVWRMIAAIRIDQSEDMLGFAENCHNVGALNNHGGMGSCDHP